MVDKSLQTGYTVTV